MNAMKPLLMLGGFVLAFAYAGGAAAVDSAVAEKDSVAEDKGCPSPPKDANYLWAMIDVNKLGNIYTLRKTVPITAVNDIADWATDCPVTLSANKSSAHQSACNQKSFLYNAKLRIDTKGIVQLTKDDRTTIVRRHATMSPNHNWLTLKPPVGSESEPTYYIYMVDFSGAFFGGLNSIPKFYQVEYFPAFVKTVENTNSREAACDSEKPENAGRVVSGFHPSNWVTPATAGEGNAPKSSGKRGILPSGGWSQGDTGAGAEPHRVK